MVKATFKMLVKIVGLLLRAKHRKLHKKSRSLIITVGTKSTLVVDLKVLLDWYIELLQNVVQWTATIALH